MANTDIEQLVVQMSADFRSFQQEFAKANGVATKTFNEIQRKAWQTDKQLDQIGKNMARSLMAPLAGVGAALGARELIDLTDTWTDLNARVRIAAGGIREGADTMERLSDVARRTYSDLELTAEGYLLNSTALRELGYTTDQTLDYVEAVNNAMVVSGAKGQRATAVMNNLSQAMQLGTLQGQNLTYILQNGGRVTELIAEELGVATTQLRELGREGKLTGELIYRVLTKNLERLRDEADSMEATIGDAFILLRNSFLEYVGGMDHAAGASLRIAEAIILVADNLDGVANAALAAATAIAGALAGRAIVGATARMLTMAKALGDFLRLARSAQGLAGLGAAFSSLGVAAGPVGLIVGGATALAIGHMANEATSARNSIQRITDDMEAMGHVGASVADSLNEAAEATEALTRAEARRQAEQVRTNLDVLRHGTAADRYLSGFTSNRDLNNLDAIALRGLAGGGWGTSEIDARAYESIRQLAEGLRDGSVAAERVRAQMQAIRETDVTQPVVDLAEALDEVARQFMAHEFNLAIVGPEETEAVRALNQELISALETRRAWENMRANNQPFIDELDALIAKLREGGMEADEARAEIERLAGMNPRFAGHLSGLQSLIDKLAEAWAEARALNNELNSVDAGASRAEQLRTFRDASYASMAPILKGQEYLTEQERRNALTKEQRDLEDEIARIRRDMPDGAFLSDKQVADLAAQNLAVRESTRSRGGGQSPQEQYDEAHQSVQQRLNDLREETALLSTLNPLVNDYGYAEQKLRIQQELRNAASKAGIAIDGEVVQAIDQLAHEYAEASVSAAQLAEAQDAARQSMEDWFDLAKSATRSFIDDLIDGKSAAEALGNALSQLGSHLINLGLGSLFGTGGGNFGLIGQLFNLPGKQFGGRVTKGQPYIVGEKRPEVFVPDQSGTIIPRVPNPSDIRAMQGANDNQPASFTFAPVIDARGADVAAVARLEQVVQRQQVEFEGRVKQIVKGRGQKWR